MLERWKEFRRKQRAALRESNRSTALLAAELSGQTVERDERVERGDGGLLNGVLPPTEGATHPAEPRRPRPRATSRSSGLPVGH